MHRLLTAAAALTLMAGAAPATAAACKDAKGRFIKCPPKPTSPTRCKDARGKFVKCGTAGARPV